MHWYVLVVAFSVLNGKSLFPVESLLPVQGLIEADVAFMIERGVSEKLFFICQLGVSPAMRM